MEDVRALGSSEKQETLIREYCAEAEKLMAAATDYVSAVQVKDTLCERFQKDCDSTLVTRATRQHLENLLKDQWGAGKHGNDTTVDHH